MKTETETIERALDAVLDDDERNRRAWPRTKTLSRQPSAKGLTFMTFSAVWGKSSLAGSVFDTSVYISALR